MKNFYIEERCTQDWESMPKTTNGTYCSQCSMEVHDFTNKSPEEIRAMLYQFKDKQLCTRMTRDQERAINTDYQLWKVSTQKHMQRATFFTFLLIFGLSIVSCSVESDKQQLQSIRQQALEVLNTQDELNDMKSITTEITDPSSDVLANKITPPVEPEYIEQEPLVEVSLDTIIYDQKPTINFEDIPDREYILGGAVISTVHYADYLEEVVPEEDRKFDENGNEIPTSFGITAYPNPTAGLTQLKLNVPESSEINISVHNMTGQTIHDFNTREYYPGTHELRFDLTDHPVGMYLVIVQSKNFKEIVKVSKQ